MKSSLNLIGRSINVQIKRVLIETFVAQASVFNWTDHVMNNAVMQACINKRGWTDLFSYEPFKSTWDAIDKKYAEEYPDTE